ncbi:hypothetical protein [Solirubrobacter pauli]|uniref:hypothetical protein n=1 Tax=Solirubrobacter pauli TaxID=166793 RepID=UPI0011C3D822|nr:hypothetical protein [Solirubrobacter pauli]
MFRRRARLSAARVAASVAAQDERAFDADFVVGVALRCHQALERARASRDWRPLEAVIAPGLLEQLRAGWSVRNPAVGPRTLQTPRVRVVSVENTRDPTAARCVLELGFEGGVSPLSGQLRPLRALEYWTFRRDDGRWKLAAVDASRDAGHHWDERLIADAADDPAMRSEAVFELAADDAVDDPALASGLVSAGAGVRTALADLALVDERFAWHVVVLAVERCVGAWTAASEHGAPGPLLALASESCTKTLLHPPGAPGPVVVRALRVVDVAPVTLRARSHPVSLTVAVTLRGKLAVRTPDGNGLVRGSARRRTTFTLRWRLAVDAQRPSGWRLDAVASGWLDRAVS